MSPDERRRREGKREKVAARIKAAALIEPQPASAPPKLSVSISIYPEEWNKKRLEAARRKRKPAPDEPGEQP
jgi:hypothetical protein